MQIRPRSRPKTQKNWDKEGPRKRWLLYMDESGGSRLNLTRDSRFFAVGGLLIPSQSYPDLDHRWSAWKREWIGREQATMHADRLQRRSIGYYAKGKRGVSVDDILNRLDKTIDGFEATLFVAAIDKQAFQEQYHSGTVDPFLHGGHYEICLDLLLERIVYCLLERDDAHAHVFAESRNRAEDATLQLEYQRLQIEGTLFHASTWFRYQLGPHITFHGKTDNIAGLQLVDILLKAVTEKLVEPTNTPLRWPAASRRLYCGRAGRVLGWGLKLFPDNPTLLESVMSEYGKIQTEDAL